MFYLKSVFCLQNLAVFWKLACASQIVSTIFHYSVFHAYTFILSAKTCWWKSCLSSLSLTQLNEISLMVTPKNLKFLKSLFLDKISICRLLDQLLPIIIQNFTEIPFKRTGVSGYYEIWVIINIFYLRFRMYFNYLGIAVREFLAVR